jgi:tartrate dehydrogenase/decarboxylase/D-malate dehydrogenase
VRENSEGEYQTLVAASWETDFEMAMQENGIHPSRGRSHTSLRLELAQSRPEKHLTSATKSNEISITMPYWDER